MKRKSLSLILTICFIMSGMFMLTACDKTSTAPTNPIPAAHTHAYDNVFYVVEEEKAYKVTACECEEQSSKEEVVGAIIVTKSNFATEVKNAAKNSTIVLDKGMYSKQTFTGDAPFKDGLTFIGTKNAFVAGIDVNSGSTNEDTVPKDLPKDMTFKNITFIDSLKIWNGDIDGLTVSNCEFRNGAHLEVDPVRCVRASAGSKAHSKTSSDNNRSKDVIIENCTFTGGAIGYSRNELSYERSSVMLYDISGTVTIKNNYIDGPNLNGLTIAVSSENRSTYKKYNQGTVLIEGNEIKNVGARAIRFDYLTVAGSSLTIKNNKFANVDTFKLEDNAGKIVKVTNIESGLTCVFEGNIYEDVALESTDERVAGF